MYRNSAQFLLAVLALTSGIATAQNYPARPVHLIVPYAAGGGVDINARLIAPKLSEPLGQPALVDNRPGAGTVIGTRAMLQAPPDGYTILIHSTTIMLASLTEKAAGYKMSDVVVLHPVTAGQLAFSVNQSVPAKNLAELIAYARANPGKLSSISLGAGSIAQLAFDRFRTTAGFDVLTVTYGGSGAATQAITGGVVDMFLDGAITAINAAKTSKTRLLAVTGTQRHRLVPEVPTFTELGFPMMSSAITWTAIFASAKTPDQIVQRLRSDLGKVINSPELQERFTAMGYDRTVPAQDFPAFIQESQVLWEQDIRRAGLALAR